MAQPPKARPHSDIDGVHRDERRNVDSAIDAGEDSGTVAAAKRDDVARPRADDDQPNADDRSR